MKNNNENERVLAYQLISLVDTKNLEEISGGSGTGTHSQSSTATGVPHGGDSDGSASMD